MTSIIDQLIEGKTAEIVAANTAKIDERKRRREELLASMKESIPPIWDLITELSQKTGEPVQYKTEGEGDNETLIFDLPAFDNHRLAPIKVRWNQYGLRSGNYHSKRPFQVWRRGDTYNDLASALHAARVQYPEYEKRRIEDKADQLQKDLNFYYTPRDMTEDQAREIARAFVAEVPEMEDRARELLAEWIGRNKKYQENQEQERRDNEIREARRVLLHTIRLGYVSKLAAWLKEYEETLEANKAAAARMQKDLDVAMYEVYKINYTIVSNYYEDGEEYREIETRFAYTLDEKPSGGYWNINGKKIEFLQAFSRERMTVKPSDGILSQEVERKGATIHFAPLTKEENIDSVFDVLSPLPEEPEIPEELRGAHRGDLIRDARSLLNGGAVEEDSLAF